MKNLVVGLVFMSSLAVAGIASACDVVGKNKHIGNLVSVDKETRTFTIVDSETREEISFRASQQLLSMLSPDRYVKVQYRETDDGQLETVALQFI